MSKDSLVKKDIIIIGAGAAGLFAAHCLKETKKEIAILEHNEKVGKKILISGGGRCNFTNIYSDFGDFQSSNQHFCKSALSRFSPYAFVDLVEKAGIKFFEKKLGQLFCQNSSKEIVQMFLNLIGVEQIELKLNSKVISISHSEGTFCVQTKSDTYECHDLIIATGGLSVPAIGATDFGHKIAKQFGHKIIPTTPALVPFLVKGTTKLSGVSTIGRVTCGEKVIEEDILFTHKGLSGPAILKISLYWDSNLPIIIDWLPGFSIHEYWENAPGRESVTKGFKGKLPSALIEALFDRAGVDRSKNIGDLSKIDREKIVGHFHKDTYLPHGTEGFRKAEVTKGGVDTSNVSSKNMESKLQKGLYFIGEVLDVTGQLGGHNFQWAWASAHAMASSIIGKD